MQTLILQQGSPEWCEFRAAHFTASDAPAMLGVSPYKTRIELLKEKKYGIVKEIDAHTQRRFDDGHRFEALARPVAESRAGEELYPVVGVSDKYPRLAASFDGLTMDETLVWEHKTLSDAYRNCRCADDLPEHLLAQIEHQMLVANALECLFTATSWDENDQMTGEVFFTVTPNAERRQRIIDGWTQFEKDMAEFETPEAARPEVIAVAPDALPALFVQVKGEVVSSNLDAFRSKALAVFDSIKTDLSTDEDFASAEKAVKWCKDVETRCEATKEQVIGQMSSIEEVTRTLGIVQERARQTRLVLEKAVKAQKDALRIERIHAAQERYETHCDTLKVINTMTITPPRPDFAGVIKGLKTLSSIDAALDTELARVKIDANALETLVRDNLDWYGQNAAGYESLFHDLPGIIQKPAEDFRVAVNYRIDQAKKAEAARLEAERERIRKEEQAKAEAQARRQAEEEARAKAKAEAEEKAKAEAEARYKAQAEAEAMRKKIRQEEQAKAEAEASAKAASPLPPGEGPGVREKAANNAPEKFEDYQKTQAFRDEGAARAAANEVLSLHEPELTRKLFTRLVKLTADELELIIHHADRLIAHRKEAA